MDSTNPLNPYSDSPSYSYLLHSQNFQYGKVRPEGSKAAKARRNNTQGIKSIAEYTTVMELKKEDLVMKERLSKLAILDTLLAKPGPLSEAEEVVKNKLLAQYF
ncbi:hypothetical protein DY000_02029305 [Brassica cretica]|uniref:Uncharacterized protein n=1 Tax=Brassica cretica TaxID=69181 RepID=A0ABQ7DD53_BRACR|nr:hypothetical protein DY000_02029305 [Brassica cretica]